MINLAHNKLQKTLNNLITLEHQKLIIVYKMQNNTNNFLSTFNLQSQCSASSNSEKSLKTIALTNGIGKLNIKAANGVYMVIITNNKTNERVIKKLAIQK